MQHKYLGNLQCPIARSLERVGEWWSILILRDAFLGSRRFDEFQKSLGIAPNMLTRRLSALVDSGLLERRLYSDRPPRYEYLLTPRGRDFRPVLWALLAWGNKHFAPEGESVMVVDAETGERAEPILVDKRSGRPMRPPEFAVIAGPAADERTRNRYAKSRRDADAARIHGEPDSPPSSQPERAPAMEPEHHSAAVSANEPEGHRAAKSVSPNEPLKQRNAKPKRAATQRQKPEATRSKSGAR